MVNNPFVMLAQLEQSGGDINRELQRMANQSRDVKKCLDMMHGKTSAELQCAAQKIATDHGFDLNTVIRCLGIRFPGRR